MPIRPENRGRYPAAWPAISKRIRNRALNRCECDGRCGRHRTFCPAVNQQPHPRTGSSVVLTVAHLNHTPEDCRDENLMAMCQACHLAYDAAHHAETAARTRREAQIAAGQGELL